MIDWKITPDVAKHSCSLIVASRSVLDTNGVRARASILSPVGYSPFMSPMADQGR